MDPQPELKSSPAPSFAEGVDIEEQKDVLVSLDCKLLQGYLLGRPSPRGGIRECADEFRTQLSRRGLTRVDV